MKLKVPAPTHSGLPHIYAKITENTFWERSDLILGENVKRGEFCQSETWPDGHGVS